MSDKGLNSCSTDKQEDRGRREMEVKPLELALTEEHMSRVTGRTDADLILHANLINHLIS